RDSDLQTILKATVLGDDNRLPSSLPGGETARRFINAGAIEPPYDPEFLCRIFEHSNSLRQTIDAYATNIDGFGHRLEPAIDFDDDDADERVAECIYLERIAGQDSGEAPQDDEPGLSDEEIEQRKKELKRLSRIEQARLASFFDSCCSDYSFVDLRRRTRQDLEITGNAYWEILRNGRGEVARLVYVPSYTVRLLPLDLVAVEVEERVRISPVSFETTKARRRVRRFIQIQGAERVYFKQYGDPSIVSKKTGKVFKSIDDLNLADPTDAPATEMIHFKIHSPRSPYG
ncbi:MAG: phage portal protein, partial [Deltaproteobacteria bacterium]|nr:phage portal protein [Deltaproteobacteria bacterium]